MIEFPFKTKVKNEEGTKDLAKQLAQVFQVGDIICLNGNLGTGKTYFVKEFCKHFKIDNVSSPSFSIVNEYIGDIKVIHFDFYRIKNVNELYDIGFSDYILEGDSMVFIEWANLFPELLPNNYYEITIKLIDENIREFELIKHE